MEFLAEIDRRRLYAIRGYSSLWEYVHKALGYSEAQSSERVSAMRLMERVPEVKEELKAGKLTLTTTAKLASHVRQEKFERGDVREILKEVSGKSTREVERVLAQGSTALARPDHIKVVSQTTSRITIDVEQEFLLLMKKVYRKNSDISTPAQKPEVTSMPKSIPPSTQAIIKSPTSTSLRAPEVRSENTVVIATHPRADPSLKRSRYISAETKARIRLRSGGCCEFIDPRTKRRCESRMSLEFDHIVPYAMGGSNEVENIRHFCKAHNRLEAVRAFGRKVIGRYLRH